LSAVVVLRPVRACCSNCKARFLTFSSQQLLIALRGEAAFGPRRRRAPLRSAPARAAAASNAPASAKATQSSTFETRSRSNAGRTHERRAHATPLQQSSNVPLRVLLSNARRAKQLKVLKERSEAGRNGKDGRFVLDTLQGLWLSVDRPVEHAGSPRFQSRRTISDRGGTTGRTQQVVGQFRHSAHSTSTFVQVSVCSSTRAARARTLRRGR